MKRMFSSCREYGIREPELLEIGDSFRVNLYRPSFSGTRKSSPKSLSHNLNPTQQKIIDMILINPKITQKTIAEEWGITTRAVKSSIKKLTEESVIERIGSARGGIWKVNKQVK